MSNRIPRLQMEQLEPTLRETLRPRVDRLGYLGEFFKCAGHVPDVLRHYMEMTEALKRVLPDRLTETVALSIAVKAHNDYERNQHELLSRRLGFDLDWIRQVEALDPERQPLMSEAERAAQSYALVAMSCFGHGCSQEFERLLDETDHTQAMAVALLVGRYVTHAIVVNTLELLPPKPSVFVDAEMSS